MTLGPGSWVTVTREKKKQAACSINLSTSGQPASVSKAVRGVVGWYQQASVLVPPSSVVQMDAAVGMNAWVYTIVSLGNHTTHEAIGTIGGTLYIHIWTGLNRHIKVELC